jgi:hypothetical protein
MSKNLSGVPLKTNTVNHGGHIRYTFIYTLLRFGIAQPFQGELAFFNY